MPDKLVKQGLLLCEICLLLMLYSATLLAPIHFGFARIGSVLFFAATSGAFAYFASVRSKSLAGIKNRSFKQVFSKPPFILWIIAVAIITLQLASGLLMVYLATRK